MAEKLVMTIAEAGELLGLSVNSVRKALNSKELPSIRIGGRILIPRAGVEAMLNTAVAGVTP